MGCADRTASARSVVSRGPCRMIMARLDMKNRGSSMTPDDLAELDRERREADVRYNDALTAFDAALVRTPPRADIGLVADSTRPSVPAGWRGWRLRAVQRWLTPWMERQNAFQARTADAIETLVSRDHERATAF